MKMGPLVIMHERNLMKLLGIRYHQGRNDEQGILHAILKDMKKRNELPKPVKELMEEYLENK